MIRNRLALAAIVLSLLCGCGQTGPLFLPGKPGEVQQPPAADDADPQDEADDDD